MPPRTGWAFLLFFTIALQAARAEMKALAPKTWERDADGKWVQVGKETSSPSSSSPSSATTQRSSDFVENPTLDRIERLLSNRRYRAARKPIIDWIKTNPTATDRDRGLFLLAEMYDQAGDKVRAFYHLDELLDYHPESRLFYPALEKQFAIADRFLKGHKRKFLGIPLLTTEDEGVEILFRIQERAPGSPIAERSLLRTADHYYDTSQFDLASDAYAAYARSYPRSPDVPRVRLREAFSSLAQFRGLRFDATPVIDAKAQLEDVQAEYPQLAQQENVADVLERIDGILAARVAQTASFYERTREPRAAVYNWRYLVENYPETAEAERARAKLERAPAWALELPAPTGGRATEAEQLRTPAAPDAKVKQPSDRKVSDDVVPPSIDTTRDKTQ